MQHHLLRAAAAALCGIAVATPGLAHPTLENQTAIVGRPYKATFRVPHGCDGSATVKVTVQIPEGVIGVKPMPKPGWQIEIVKGPYAKAYPYFHGEISEGARTVSWSGGKLLDEHYDEFTLSGFMAADLPSRHPTLLSAHPGLREGLRAMERYSQAWPGRACAEISGARRDAGCAAAHCAGRHAHL